MPDERLLREINPPIGEKAGFLPQHKVEGTDAYEETVGSGGALHTKDKDVVTRLASLEAKIDSILDGTTPAKIYPTGNVVEDYWEGASSTTRTFTEAMTGVSIANDGVQTLTFTINGVTRTLYPGEPYTGTLKPFTQISISATDKYRAEVMK